MKPEYQVQFRMSGYSGWGTASRHRLLPVAVESLQSKRKWSERQPAVKYRLVKVVVMDV